MILGFSTPSFYLVLAQTQNFDIWECYSTLQVTTLQNTGFIARCPLLDMFLSLVTFVCAFCVTTKKKELEHNMSAPLYSTEQIGRVIGNLAVKVNKWYLTALINFRHYLSLRKLCYSRGRLFDSIEFNAKNFICPQRGN